MGCAHSSGTQRNTELQALRGVRTHAVAATRSHRAHQLHCLPAPSEPAESRRWCTLHQQAATDSKEAPAARAWQLGSLLASANTTPRDTMNGMADAMGSSTHLRQHHLRQG